MYVESFKDISQEHFSTVLKGIKEITSKRRIVFFNTICSVSYCNVHVLYVTADYSCHCRDAVILQSAIQLVKFRFTFLTYFRYFISLQGHGVQYPVP